MSNTNRKLVHYVEHEGQELPFRVSYMAISKWQAETKKDLGDLDEVTTDLTLLEPLFYQALVVGHKFEKRELKIEREDVEMILDLCMVEFLTALTDFFQEVEAGTVQRGPKDTPPKKKRK